MADRSRSGALPIIGQRPAERADAARNRRKILHAADRLIAEIGAEHLSLDEVAAAANVGVGTVYRRFGDRTGLVLSLLDDRECQFQEAFMQGPPPLGPGAPPEARIRAFLHAVVDRVDEQPELLLVAETTTPTVRYSTGPYPLRHVHLVTLLTQLKSDASAHYLAHALLAPTSASLIVHQRRNEGLSVDEIKSSIDDLLQLIGVSVDPPSAT